MNRGRGEAAYHYLEKWYFPKHSYQNQTLARHVLYFCCFNNPIYDTISFCQNVDSHGHYNSRNNTSNIYL